MSKMTNDKKMTPFFQPALERQPAQKTLQRPGRGVIRSPESPVNDVSMAEVLSNRHLLFHHHETFSSKQTFENMKPHVWDSFKKTKKKPADSGWPLH